MSTPARFLFSDLFAGIGGFHAALSEMGGHGVFASEIDKTAKQVYADNHGLEPDDDIRKVDEQSVEDHDILCAGFPCQAFSKAGSQLGLKDTTRGTLFFEVARLLEAKKPRFIALENVRNLYAHDGGRTWSVIIARLHELGYRVSRKPVIFSPHLLPPSMGGAPQFRERVFILGELREKSDDLTSPLDWDLHVPNKPPVAWWNPQDWDLKRWLQEHPATEADLSPYEIDPEAEERYILAWGDLARRIGDRLPGFPLWEWAFVDEPDLGDEHPDWKKDFHRKNSLFYRKYRGEIEAWRGVWHPETFPNSRRKFEWQAQDSPRDKAEQVRDLLIHLRPSGIRVKRPTYVPALVAITQTSILGWQRRRMTPSEAATLQGLPRDFRLHESPSIAYRHLGNGVNVGVVQFLVKALFDHCGYTNYVDPLAGAELTAPDVQLPMPLGDHELVAV